MGAGSGAAVVLGDGSGVGDSVGAGESVGAADAVSTGASTVPRIGLSKSSANERGVTINMQRTTSAKMAFFIVDSGVLAMVARVMMKQKMNIFGRVLTVQIGRLVGLP